jgi:hypothetical protein
MDIILDHFSSHNLLYSASFIIHEYGGDKVTHLTAKRMGKYIRKHLRSFLTSGYAMRPSGHLLVSFLRELGYESENILLAHRLAYFNISTPYFQLLAENFTPFIRDYPALTRLACHSLETTDYFLLRLCLAILSEIGQEKRIIEHVEKNLYFRSPQDIDSLSPLIVLLIKGATEITLID